MELRKQLRVLGVIDLRPSFYLLLVAQELIARGGLSTGISPVLMGWEGDVQHRYLLSGTLLDLLVRCLSLRYAFYQCFAKSLS